jgi:hypothetical protein
MESRLPLCARYSAQLHFQCVAVTPITLLIRVNPVLLIVDRWGDARMRLRGRRQCHRLGGLHYGCSSAPEEFDVKGAHVAMVAATRLLASGGSVKDPQAVRRDITVGAYVEVTGRKDWQTNTVVAAVVEFRDETGQTVSAGGVIDRVIVTGAEPIFRADGWLLAPHQP